MPTERDHQIRERAYSLWEADGCPEGKEMDYWLRAEQDLNGVALKPARKSKSSAKSTTARATKSTSSTKKATASKTTSKRASSKKAPTAKS